MENDERQKDDDDASPNPTPTVHKTKKRNTQTKSVLKQDKSKNQNKKSFRKSWRGASPITKLTLIFTGIAAAAAAAVGYTLVAIWQTLQAKWAVQIEHAPLVINSRPPEMLQPFMCSSNDLQTNLQTGNIRTYIKNVGNARAIKVTPSFLQMKIVPEQKTGQPVIDSRPQVNCDNYYEMPGAEFNLAPGQENFSEIRQGALAFTPSLPEGAVVQLYSVICVNYSDEYGGHHVTCDTYRFYMPSSNPLDVLSGSPSFICDRTPKVGRFLGDLTGHCQK